MKVKIRRKSLKEAEKTWKGNRTTDPEDTWRKGPKAEPTLPQKGKPEDTERTPRNLEGGEYKTPAERREETPLKSDPTVKEKNPFVDDFEPLATSDYPKGKEPRIKLPPTLGGVRALDKSPPEEVFFNDDMEEPDPYGRKSRLGESVDKDAKFQPLQEIARRHFKKG